MRLQLNGKLIEEKGEKTLLGLMEDYKVLRQNCVVELNERIIPIEQVEKITLKDGDKIELVRFVGGG